MAGKKKENDLFEKVCRKMVLIYIRDQLSAPFRDVPWEKRTAESWN